MSNLSFIEELIILYQTKTATTRVLIEHLTDEQQKHLKDHGFNVEPIVIPAMLDKVAYYIIDITNGKWSPDSKTVTQAEISRLGNLRAGLLLTCFCFLIMSATVRRPTQGVLQGSRRCTRCR